jgi:hypothetical protein
VLFQVQALKTGHLVEIKGFKTGPYLGVKTALVRLVTAGSEGHVECPESEPADDDIQFSLSKVLLAPSETPSCPGSSCPRPSPSRTNDRRNRRINRLLLSFLRASIVQKGNSGRYDSRGAGDPPRVKILASACADHLLPIE